MASIPYDTGFYHRKEQVLYIQLPSQSGTARGETVNKFSMHQFTVQETKDAGKLMKVASFHLTFLPASCSPAVGTVLFYIRSP